MAAHTPDGTFSVTSRHGRQPTGPHGGRSAAAACHRRHRRLPPPSSCCSQRRRSRIQQPTELPCKRERCPRQLQTYIVRAVGAAPDCPSPASTATSPPTPRQPWSSRAASLDLPALRRSAWSSDSCCSIGSSVCTDVQTDVQTLALAPSTPAAAAQLERPARQQKSQRRAKQAAAIPTTPAAAVAASLWSLAHPVRRRLLPCSSPVAPPVPFPPSLSGFSPPCSALPPLFEADCCTADA